MHGMKIGNNILSITPDKKYNYIDLFSGAGGFALGFHQAGFNLLFLLYALILVRGLIISWRAQSSFARLLAGALIATFFFGLIVNLGMVSGLLPVVGVPLPMVSWGGTAMVSMMIAFGMLMAISTEHSVTQGMR